MDSGGSIDELLSSESLTLEVARKLIASQQKQIEELRSIIEELQKRNPTKRLDESYSAQAEENRKAREEQAAARKKKKAERRNKRKNRGARMTTADKVAQAERTETIFPAGRSADECRFSHTRVAWRLEGGRAVLIAYEIYRCGNEFGKPAGLPGRGEFGIEIMVALAYQVYVVGVSIDNACRLLNFFEQLKLRKSQADALLNQLARAWESEFETLCRLLANATIVHCDETSWSIHSVWAFLSDKLTVLFYGVHKDGATLAEILDKDDFCGTLFSDNAAVYQGFNSSQKCWAHLIRKAIKLTLEDPDDADYRRLADDLMLIYRDAKKAATDGRLGDAGRQQRISQLEDRIVDACLPGWTNADVGGTGTGSDYHRLCNEIMKLVLDGELLVFVRLGKADGTNNVSERQLRGDALARRTGRTNKTARGAKRQSIISSVLQSIGKQLTEFRLQSVIDEVARWTAVGQSCFDAMRETLRKNVSSPLPDRKGILDQIILNADP